MSGSQEESSSEHPVETKEKKTKKVATPKREKQTKKVNTKKETGKKSTKAKTTVKKEGKKKVGKKSAPEDKEVKKSSLEKWIIEAISSKRTDDKQYVGQQSICKYIIQYCPEINEARAKRTVTSHLNKMTETRVLRRKKDSYSLGSKTDPVSIPKRKVVREFTKVPKIRNDPFVLVGI